MRQITSSLVLVDALALSLSINETAQAVKEQ
jgi:hypothetical protein